MPSWILSTRRTCQNKNKQYWAMAQKRNPGTAPATLSNDGYQMLPFTEQKNASYGYWMVLYNKLISEYKYIYFPRSIENCSNTSLKHFSLISADKHCTNFANVNNMIYRCMNRTQVPSILTPELFIILFQSVCIIVSHLTKILQTEPVYQHRSLYTLWHFDVLRTHRKYQAYQLVENK